MAVCENCGIDHNQQTVESFPDFLFLERAHDAAREIETKKIPAGVTVFSKYVSDDHMEDFMDWAQNHNLPPRQAVEVFGAMMFRFGWLAGNMTHHHWPELFEPQEYPDLEEAEKIRVEREEANVSSLENLSEALGVDVVDLLKKKGVIPDDFDGEIRIASVDSDDLASAIKNIKGEKGDDSGPLPGMYL